MYSEIEIISRAEFRSRFNEKSYNKFIEIFLVDRFTPCNISITHHDSRVISQDFAEIIEVSEKLNE